MCVLGWGRVILTPTQPFPWNPIVQKHCSETVQQASWVQSLCLSASDLLWLRTQIRNLTLLFWNAAQQKNSQTLKYLTDIIEYAICTSTGVFLCFLRLIEMLSWRSGFREIKFHLWSGCLQEGTRLQLLGIHGSEPSLVTSFYLPWALQLPQERDVTGRVVFKEMVCLIRDDKFFNSQMCNVCFGLNICQAMVWTFSCIILFNTLQAPCIAVHDYSPFHKWGQWQKVTRAETQLVNMRTCKVTVTLRENLSKVR